MPRRVETQCDVLRQLAVVSRYHFDIAASHRCYLGALWARGFVCLRLGDAWEITALGRDFLRSGGAFH